MQIQKYSNVLAVDPSSSLKNLKNLKNIDNQTNAKEVSQQFEALFLQMVLKSMRDSVQKDDLFGSDGGTDQYVSMFDQQLAYNISKTNKGIGFASKIEEQIMRYINTKNNLEEAFQTSEQTKFNPMPEFNPKMRIQSSDNSLKGLIEEAKQKNLAQNNNISDLEETKPKNIVQEMIEEVKQNKIVQNSTISENVDVKPKNFVQEILKESLKTAQNLGIKPEFVLGHAALESGWGKSIPKFENGESSYNIFSVKANKNWTGKTIDVTTTEYVDGKPIKVVEKFKAYASYKEAFNDYENLLKSSPRYKNVVNAENSQEFASGLQKAGYATDPKYTEKLNQVINGNRLKSSIIA